MENIAVYLFLWVFLGGVIWVLLTLLAKFLKGTIHIHTYKRNYNYGEQIKGTFTLRAKKSIRWQDLSVHLICFRKERTYSKGKSSTRTVEVQRFSHHIESGVHYEMWLKRDYDILLQIPSKKQIFGNEEIPDLWQSVFGKLARYSLRKIGQKNYTWQLRVDLQADGLDISGKRDIFITESVGIR